MKNFYKIPRAKLVDEAISAANAFASGKASSLLPVQSAEFAATLLAMAELLRAANRDAVAKRSASKAATDVAQGLHKQVAKIMSGAKYSMRGVDASAVEFDAVGFKPPAEIRSMVTPETPSRLAASGGNGHVRLRYDGNNASGSVVYQIYAQDTPKGRWELVGATTKQRFVHHGVRPGEFHQYEVKAQASNGTFSEASNTAVVYPNG